MIALLCVVAMIAAFTLIRRGYDVRPVLFTTALAIGALAGRLGVVYRRMAEALTDAKYVLPICSAMAFGYVVREAGCVDDLVSLLLRPFTKRSSAAHRAHEGTKSDPSKFVLPGTSTIAFLVNTAIPSQTSTLAAVGPLSVDLMTRLGETTASPPAAIRAGTFLVFGASIAGELLNPGVAQVIAVARTAGIETPRLVVWFLPATLTALIVGTFLLLVTRRRADDVVRLSRPHGEAAVATEDSPKRRFTLRAILPLLPVAWLMASHPSLPTRRVVAAVTPADLEVFTAMLAGIVLTIVFAARDRAKATRAMLEGLGFAFAHIITLIAVSAGIAKALEVAGVLSAFVGWASGNPSVVLAIAFALAFSLGVLSGSGVGPSVALVAALGPRAAELGVQPLALGGALLFGAEAGRTASPVAAVVIFGGSLVAVPPRTLAWRLFVPCLVAAVAGTVVCVARAQ